MYNFSVATAPVQGILLAYKDGGYILTLLNAILILFFFIKSFAKYTIANLFSLSYGRRVSLLQKRLAFFPPRRKNKLPVKKLVLFLSIR